jgi:hypothetical protein
MPYQVKESELVSRWKDGNTDAIGKPYTTISLLLLTSFRYLGREVRRFVICRSYRHK